MCAVKFVEVFFSPVNCFEVQFSFGITKTPEKIFVCLFLLQFFSNIFGNFFFLVKYFN